MNHMPMTQGTRLTALKALEQVRAPRQRYFALRLAPGTDEKMIRSVRDRTPGGQFYLPAMDGPMLPLVCDRTGLAALRAAGVDSAAVPLAMTPLSPDSNLGFLGNLGGDADAPLLVELTCQGRLGKSVSPLIVPFTAPGHAPLGYFAGFLSQSQSASTGASKTSDAVDKRCVLRLPDAAFGPSAQVAILLGLDHLLDGLARTGQACPVLLRIDYAGLGLSRSELRVIESRVSQVLSRYGAVTGKPGLLLGELGFIREYADATVMLDPGASCRLDLTLPTERRHPTLLNLHQQAGGEADFAPLNLMLAGPEGDSAELTTGAQPRLAMLHGNAGWASASIASAGMPGSTRRRLTHAIALGPTNLKDTISQCQAAPGEWEVTVCNTGTVPAALTFVLDDAMPLLPRWQLPRATIRRSRSHSWDPEMLEFTRPAFFDLRSRLDALVRHGDEVPDLVIRRIAEPTIWPMVSIARGLRLSRMNLDQPGRAMTPLAIDDRQPGQGGSLTDTLALQGDDALIDKCLDMLRHARPATVAGLIEQILDPQAG